MESDPEFKEAYLQAAMEARFCKKRSASPLERIVRMKKLPVELGMVAHNKPSAGRAYELQKRRIVWNQKPQERLCHVVKRPGVETGEAPPPAYPTIC